MRSVLYLSIPLFLILTFNRLACAQGNCGEMIKKCSEVTRNRIEQAIRNRMSNVKIELISPNCGCDSSNNFVLCNSTFSVSIKPENPYLYKCAQSEMSLQQGCQIVQFNCKVASQPGPNMPTSSISILPTDGSNSQRAQH